MTLRAGVTLGPYEIVGPIGAGAMGEVYKATDTRLERPCRRARSQYLDRRTGHSKRPEDYRNNDCETCE